MVEKYLQRNNYRQLAWTAEATLVCSTRQGATPAPHTLMPHTQHTRTKHNAAKVCYISHYVLNFMSVELEHEGKKKKNPFKTGNIQNFIFLIIEMNIKQRNLISTS